MDTVRQRLRRHQIDGIAVPSAPSPPAGWIRAVREALGMSLEAMAQRMGVTRQSAHQLEAAEVAGSITLRRLRAAADALECDVYLRLIPRTSLEQTVRTQAERKARANLLRIQQTMAMEAQALSPEVLEAMIQQEAQNLIAKGGSSLWD